MELQFIFADKLRTGLTILCVIMVVLVIYKFIIASWTPKHPPFASILINKVGTNYSVSLELPFKETVIIELLDENRKQIALLKSEEYLRGNHTIEISENDILADGKTIKVTAGNHSFTRRI